MGCRSAKDVVVEPENADDIVGHAPEIAQSAHGDRAAAPVARRAARRVDPAEHRQHLRGRQDDLRRRRRGDEIALDRLEQSRQLTRFPGLCRIGRQHRVGHLAQDDGPLGGRHRCADERANCSQAMYELRQPTETDRVVEPDGVARPALTDGDARRGRHHRDAQQQPVERGLPRGDLHLGRDAVAGEVVAVEAPTDVRRIDPFADVGEVGVAEPERPADRRQRRQCADRRCRAPAARRAEDGVERLDEWFVGTGAAGDAEREPWCAGTIGAGQDAEGAAQHRPVVLEVGAQHDDVPQLQVAGRIVEEVGERVSQDLDLTGPTVGGVDLERTVRRGPPERR